MKRMLFVFLITLFSASPVTASTSEAFINKISCKSPVKLTQGCSSSKPRTKIQLNGIKLRIAANNEGTILYIKPDLRISQMSTSLKEWSPNSPVLGKNVIQASLKKAGINIHKTIFEGHAKRASGMLLHLDADGYSHLKSLSKSNSPSPYSRQKGADTPLTPGYARIVAFKPIRIHGVDGHVIPIFFGWNDFDIVLDVHPGQHTFDVYTHPGAGSGSIFLSKSSFSHSIKARLKANTTYYVTTEKKNNYKNPRFHVTTTRPVKESNLGDHH